MPFGGRSRPRIADAERAHLEIASCGAARSERCDKNSRDDSSGDSHLVPPNNTLHQRRKTCRAKIGPQCGRRRDAREKSTSLSSQLVPVRGFGNTQQPQQYSTTTVNTQRPQTRLAPAHSANSRSHESDHCGRRRDARWKTSITEQRSH